jgi:hypothetical protein
LELFVQPQAFVVRHSAFHFVSGFDPSLHRALHPLDLGWRLWVAGYRVRSVGPPPSGPYELPDGPEVGSAFLTVLGSVLATTSLGSPWAEPEARRAKRDGAGRRYQIQSSRHRGDGEVLPFAHAAIRRWAEGSPTAKPLAEILQRWGAPERAGPRRRIAVVTSDTLARRMAGPGIRATEIAKILSHEHDVVLATTGICELELPGLEVRQVGSSDCGSSRTGAMSSSSRAGSSPVARSWCTATR